MPSIAIDAGIEFEMTTRRRIHRDRAVAGFHANRGQMRQALLLGFFDVAEQGARGGDRELTLERQAIVDAEAAEIVQAEELQQLAAAGVGIEQPGRTTPQAGARG